MAQVNPNVPWLRALDTDDGTPVEPDGDGWVTLAADTYAFPLNVKDAPVTSLNIETDGDFAGVITIEDTNAPRDIAKGSDATPGTVTDWAAGAPWVPEDPDDAYVATVGTGWTVANLELTKTAGAGAAMVHLSGMGAARMRAIVTCTTPGAIRIAPHGKA